MICSFSHRESSTAAAKRWSTSYARVRRVMLSQSNSPDTLISFFFFSLLLIWAHCFSSVSHPCFLMSPNILNNCVCLVSVYWLLTLLVTTYVFTGYRPEFTLLVEPPVGDPEYLIAEINLPGVVRHILHLNINTLHLSTMSLTLICPKFKYELPFKLPVLWGKYKSSRI